MASRLGNLAVILVVIPLIGISCESANFRNSSASAPRSKRETPTAEGSKRYLVFPQGSNVQLIYCMTIGTYAKPSGFFTMGVTAGLAWELPHRNTVPHRKPAEVYHRRSRRELYRKLELMLTTRGRDGKACVHKALCQAGKRNSSMIGRGTFVQEILHSIFTLPSGSYHDDPQTEYEKVHDVEPGADCDEIYPTCPEIF